MSKKEQEQFKGGPMPPGFDPNAGVGPPKAATNPPAQPAAPPGPPKK